MATTGSDIPPLCIVIELRYGVRDGALLRATADLLRSMGAGEPVDEHTSPADDALVCIGALLRKASPMPGFELNSSSAWLEEVT